MKFSDRPRNKHSWLQFYSVSRAYSHRAGDAVERASPRAHTTQRSNTCLTSLSRRPWAPTYQFRHHHTNTSASPRDVLSPPSPRAQVARDRTSIPETYFLEFARVARGCRRPAVPRIPTQGSLSSRPMPGSVSPHRRRARTGARALASPPWRSSRYSAGSSVQCESVSDCTPSSWSRSESGITSMRTPRKHTKGGRSSEGPKKRGVARARASRWQEMNGGALPHTRSEGARPCQRHTGMTRGLVRRRWMRTVGGSR